MSAVFDKIAPYYDKTRKKDTAKLMMLAERAIRDIRGCLDPVDKSKNLRVFEPGCGTGYFLKAFLEADKNIEVSGLDISEAMIQELQKKLRSGSINRDRCEVSCGDIFDNTYDAENPPDVVISHLFFHLIEKWRLALCMVLKGVDYYVHFFEDSEYFSAVTGSPLIVPRDHPLARFAELLNREIASVEGFNWYPGVYFPSDLFEVLAGSGFDLIGKHKETWIVEYSLSELKEHLDHRVMSAYVDADTEGMTRASNELVKLIENSGNRTFNLKHTLWAFVFRRKAQEI